MTGTDDILTRCPTCRMTHCLLCRARTNPPEYLTYVKVLGHPYQAGLCGACAGRVEIAERIAGPGERPPDPRAEDRDG
jgi:hypothetical protein